MMRKACLGLIVVGLFCSTPLMAQKKNPELATPRPAKLQQPRPLSDIEKLLGRPPSTELLWQVTERDLAYGLLDEAKKHLTELVARNDLTEEKVLELRETHGVGLLLRVQKFPELAEIAQPLFEKLTKASATQSTNPDRIRYFIGKLDDSASERAYAIEQLARSGPYAIPYFIEAFEQERLEPTALIRGLMAMPVNSWPAATAALDSGREPLMSLMLDLLAKLGEPRATQFMYYVAANPKYSKVIRDKAIKTIAKLLGVDPTSLPSPVRSLVSVAREYDVNPEILGLDTEIVPVWSWRGSNVGVDELPVPRAAEYFGLHAIKQALALSPDDREAKVVFLKLALDTATDRNGIANPFAAIPNGALETSLAAGSGLLAEVLDDAIKTRRTSIALAAVRALGATASPAHVSGDHQKESPLVRALDYPNSRVRFAAALAALEVHPDQSFSESERIVETLAQAIDPRQRPAVVIIDADLARGNALSVPYKEIGYEPLVATNGKDGFKLALESGLVELLVIDSASHDPSPIDTINTFEKDGRTAGVPVVVVAREPLPEEMSNELKQFEHVVVLAPIQDPKKLSEALSISLPDQTLAPWSEAERNENRLMAADWLVRVARGELKYLDPRPAIDPLTKLLRDQELGPRAAEALSYLPSADVQEELASVALDGTLDPSIRAQAARALGRNIGRGTNALTQERSKALITALSRESDPLLRLAFAKVAGAIDRDGKTAGNRFLQYTPDAEPQMPPPGANQRSGDKMGPTPSKGAEPASTPATESAPAKEESAPAKEAEEKEEPAPSKEEPAEESEK
ncbi:hypothetical protein K2Y11_11180 [bacterium]|nr:hypothetical protein [bacterium]